MKLVGFLYLFSLLFYSPFVSADDCLSLQDARNALSSANEYKKLGAMQRAKDILLSMGLLDKELQEGCSYKQEKWNSLKIKAAILLSDIYLKYPEDEDDIVCDLMSQSDSNSNYHLEQADRCLKLAESISKKSKILKVETNIARANYYAKIGRYNCVNEETDCFKQKYDDVHKLLNISSSDGCNEGKLSSDKEKVQLSTLCINYLKVYDFIKDSDGWLHEFKKTRSLVLSIPPQGEYKHLKSLFLSDLMGFYFSIADRLVFNSDSKMKKLEEKLRMEVKLILENETTANVDNKYELYKNYFLSRVELSKKNFKEAFRFIHQAFYYSNPDLNIDYSLGKIRNNRKQFSSAIACTPVPEFRKKSDGECENQPLVFLHNNHPHLLVLLGLTTGNIWQAQGDFLQNQVANAYDGSDYLKAQQAYQWAINHSEVIHNSIQFVSDDFMDLEKKLYFYFADVVLKRAAREKGKEKQKLLKTAQNTIEKFKQLEFRDYFKSDCSLKQNKEEDINKVLANKSKNTVLLYPILFDDRLELLLTGLDREILQFTVSSHELLDTMKKLNDINNFEMYLHDEWEKISFKAKLETIIQKHSDMFSNITSKNYEVSIANAEKLIKGLSSIFFTSEIEKVLTKINASNPDEDVKVVVIPYGELSNIPFYAFSTNQNKRLIDNYFISLNPSLTLTNFSDFSEDYVNEVLLGGVSYFGDGSSSLPCGSIELGTVACQLTETQEQKEEIRVSNPRNGRNNLGSLGSRAVPINGSQLKIQEKVEELSSPSNLPRFKPEKVGVLSSPSNLPRFKPETEKIEKLHNSQKTSITTDENSVKAIFKQVMLACTQPPCDDKIIRFSKGANNCVDKDTQHKKNDLDKLINLSVCQKEGQKIEKLHQDEFTLDKLLKMVNNGNHTLIHFSTHGEFGHTKYNSYLYTYDKKLAMDNLERKLDRNENIEEATYRLFVFSACETAKGSETLTLGLSGVGLKAGASAVLGTLWKVPEYSTVILMDKFYENIIEGKKPIEALRDAQKYLRDYTDDDGKKPYASFYFWAPFVFIGNWL